MAIEGRGDAYVYTRLDARYIGYDSRKVPLKMKSQGQKIRHDQHSGGAAGGYARDRFGEVGLALFEERGFYQRESTLPGKGFGHAAHRLVRRFDARSVREDDDPCFQALPAR